MELLRVPGVCLWCRRFAAPERGIGLRLKSQRLCWELQWVPEGAQGMGRAGCLQAC